MNARINPGRLIHRNKVSYIPISISVLSGLAVTFLNKSLLFTDIRGFYAMHFEDGMHHWPFSFHTLAGTTNLMHPVEYPALTGLGMWLLTFLIPQTSNALLHYFQLTGVINTIAFAFTTFGLLKLGVKKTWSIYFSLCPAVLYALNRNWDIWAVVAMVWSIYLFEIGKTKLSAMILAISIATKFFPLVLLLPVLIQYVREKKFQKFIEYFSITLATWVVINLPFALINFRGWSYFYEFNYKRGLGSASIFEIVSRLGSNFQFNSLLFYSLNIVVFGTAIWFFFISPRIIPLSQAAFFTMFAFILFNKQYSMQYIIWLTALALLAISKIDKKHRRFTVFSFMSWQIFDFFFQYAYFQNILTNTFANSPTPAAPSVSNFTYGLIGGIRYILACLFCLAAAYFIYSENKDIESKHPTKKG